MDYRTFFKNKLLWAILGLAAALTALYCVLCLVTAGAVGLPFQRSISFDRATVYSDLTDFEIQGDVLFSLSDQGSVNLHKRDDSLIKYKFVTIFVSRLSDIGKSTDITYLEENSTSSREGKTRFVLKEGRNTVRIQSGNWSEIRVRLGTREDMSLRVDKIVLSRLPVMTEYFLSVFLLLASVVCVFWYFAVFRGLGAWLIARPTWILAIIMTFQVLTMIYYVDQKRGYQIDEILSLSQANGRLTGSQVHGDADIFDKWNTSDYFSNFLTVQPGERFDLKLVYRTISRNVHPPFYHMQLHAVHSFFPNTWSKWLGAGINIFWLVAANIMLYKASKLVLKGNFSALLPCAIWGFSGGAMSNVTFFRMYATLTFFFTALTYLGILVISGREKSDFRFCIALSLVLFFGSFTQLYFFVFFALTAFALLFWLLYTKQYKQVMNCAIATVSSLGIYFYCWPNVVRQIFRSTRGRQSFENLLQTEGFVDRIKTFGNIINRQLFSGMLLKFSAIILVLLIIGAIMSLVRKTGREDGQKKALEADNFLIIFMFFNAMLFFLIIAKIAPFRTDRYIFAIYPTVALLFITLGNYALCRINKRFAVLALAFFSAFLILSDFRNKNVNYLLVRTPDVPLILAAYENPSCIVFAIPTARYRVSNSLPDFTHFERTFICSTVDNLHLGLNGIMNSREFVLYISSLLDKDEIFEDMRKIAPYKRSRMLYENLGGRDQYGFYAYLIER